MTSVFGMSPSGGVSNFFFGALEFFSGKIGREKFLSGAPLVLSYEFVDSAAVIPDSSKFSHHLYQKIGGNGFFRFSRSTDFSIFRRLAFRFPDFSKFKVQSFPRTTFSLYGSSARAELLVTSVSEIDIACSKHFCSKQSSKRKVECKPRCLTSNPASWIPSYIEVCKETIEKLRGPLRINHWLISSSMSSSTDTFEGLSWYLAERISSSSGTWFSLSESFR